MHLPTIRRAAAILAAAFVAGATPAEANMPLCQGIGLNAKSDKDARRAIDACSAALKQARPGTEQAAAALYLRAQWALKLSDSFADSVDFAIVMDEAPSFAERKQRVDLLLSAWRDADSYVGLRPTDSKGYLLRGQIYSSMRKARTSEAFYKGPLYRPAKGERTAPLPVGEPLANDEFILRAADDFSRVIEMNRDAKEVVLARFGRAEVLSFRSRFPDYQSRFLRELISKQMNPTIVETIKHDYLSVHEATKYSPYPDVVALKEKAEEGLKKLGVTSLMNDDELCRRDDRKIVDDIVAACTRLVEKAANDPRGWSDAMLRRGDVNKHVKEDNAAALADYNAVIAKQPGNVRAIVLRGHAHADVDPVRAIDDYNEALRLDPNSDWFVTYMRAETFVKLGRRDEAMRDYRTVLAALAKGDSLAGTDFLPRVKAKLQELGAAP